MLFKKRSFEIYKLSDECYGECALPKLRLLEWHTQSADGREVIPDDFRSGSRTIAQTDGKAYEIPDIFHTWGNDCQNVDEQAEEADSSFHGGDTEEHRLLGCDAV
jgi:hypothetical protein